MSVNPSDTPPSTAKGYDVAAVETWLGRHVPQLCRPLRWTRLEGGHSNLTFLIEDSNGSRAVIRRPPMGELLPKAHDMAREWSLISALADSGVPVPKALGFCDDPAVTGAHFYVMGHVDGHPLYSAADAEAWVPERCARRWRTRSSTCWRPCTRSTPKPPAWAAWGATTATSRAS